MFDFPIWIPRYTRPSPLEIRSTQHISHSIPVPTPTQVATVRGMCLHVFFRCFIPQLCYLRYSSRPWPETHYHRLLSCVRSLDPPDRGDTGRYMPCSRVHGSKSPTSTRESGPTLKAMGHGFVSGDRMMRWTNPQHPCCNPARLVLPAPTWTMSRTASPCQDKDLREVVSSLPWEDLPPPCLKFSGSSWRRHPVPFPACANQPRGVIPLPSCGCSHLSGPIAHCLRLPTPTTPSSTP
ncbi:hypothetical protein N657DRAFT_399613 [Parathielavia appendiculata]|uniref:Uncharacterized protein n=1 Tax=Parathielavia appendiculata TaxID=2587402 RepID=A0AAN6U2A8_9PEZI|nr:hypothetical protein N657DRAFT_399613 [Parathielavia appendiculata]